MSKRFQVWLSFEHRIRHLESHGFRSTDQMRLRNGREFFEKGHLCMDPDHHLTAPRLFNVIQPFNLAILGPDSGNGNTLDNCQIFM